jgi:shikimate dehydrogenase
MTTLRFAVIGDPIAHSRSPRMHRAAFAALGLPHTYDALRVSAGELEQVIAELRARTYAGLNVTIPYKQAVLSYVDEISPSARAVGAANTLVCSPSGIVVAHNTDAPALAEELRLLAGPATPWSASTTLVLGSGGAALAAVAAFTELGVGEIAVRARSFESAERREAFLRAAKVPLTLQPWIASAASEKSTRAVVQATSAGMAGAGPGESVSSIVDWSSLAPDAVALDVVYSPRDTPFLGAARARGLRCTGGLGMLARQGALAFEVWLHRSAPFETMLAAIEQA